jgi:hypothetical protein
MTANIAIKQCDQPTETSIAYGIRPKRHPFE